VIFGQVFDESLEDALRVTIVATGLGGRIAKPQPQVVYSAPMMARTGTDDAMGSNVGTHQSTPAGAINYAELDTPAVTRRRRDVTVSALASSGMDTYDIPAFLRKQAD
jgi:cell division protein FtsZ